MNCFIMRFCFPIYEAAVSPPRTEQYRCTKPIYGADSFFWSRSARAALMAARSLSISSWLRRH